MNFENKYFLNSVNYLPLSEKVIIGRKILSRNQYKIDQTKLLLSISDSVNYSIFDTIIINYKSLNLGLKKKYAHRNLIPYFDIERNDTINRSQSSIDLSSKAIFGNKLKSNGTLLRGFTVGTNKDLAVNSGLRLQLAGNISDDIEIIAALTDENTPIQPEGNTERLEELDKVFIQIKHENASATFGDYNLTTKIGEFGKINRKLQGVLGEFKYENNSASVSFAASRGKFNSQQFVGTDGVQGPYRLYGANNENDIIVIAGSEKVYLNGKQLKRGENNDYTIEYSNGEITFTPTVLITSLSRITVDFEYTTRQYERNILGANANVNLFSNKLRLKLSAFQEGDNKNSPIDISLSDDDKEILRNAGDEQYSAVKNGATLVEADSNGNINASYSYKRIEYNNDSINVFVYEPESDAAIYNVSFSYVGEGNGDYKRISSGKFEFAGTSLGAYLPIKLLPIPEKNQLGNFVVEYEPIKNINLSLELAASSYDQNTFSEFDDNDNNGFARNIKLNISPYELNFGNSSYGKLSGYFRDRYIDEKFKSIDRINDIEFDRNYNTNSTTKSEESLREAQLKYSPVDEINISGQYGLLKKGSVNKSERYLSNIEISNFHNLNLNYTFDFVNSENTLQSSNWYKNNGELSYSYWKLQSGFAFEAEDRKEKLVQNDSLLSSSEKYSTYSPFLTFNPFQGLFVTAKYSLTKELAPLNGILIDESESIVKTLALNFSSIKEFSTKLDLSIRDKNYSEAYKKEGFGNNQYIQIRSESQINFLERFVTGNLYYQTSTERSAKLEKVFIRVPEGTGTYSYLGDLNNNGIAEEEEFQIDQYYGDFIQTTIPTDELFPVIDLKVNSRWKLDFKKYFDEKNFFSSALRTLTTETIYRIEENSRILDAEKIYLLNFNYFQNDSTTIRGSNYFQQDLHIFKNDRDLSFRFRFTQLKSLYQYSNGLEKSFNKERSVRINFRMVKEINNETEFINRIENVLAPENSNRSRNVTSNEIQSDFSYRPYSNLEIGFLFKVGRIEDRFPETPTIIDENKLTFRLTLSLLQKGRLRLEIDRTELIANTSENIIPYEITNGNTLGKNYIWRTNFDYRFTSNLQAKLNYLGRFQGRGKVINTFTAEARAYF